MTHTPRARSIGSLPLPHQLRLTPCEPVPMPMPVRSPSVTSPPVHGGMMSPSRLPASDCMSYFPPFECMGSGLPSPSAEAGPSSRPDDTSDGERGHTKGRSLGSLAGLMTLLSPASSPHHTASSSSSSTPPVYRSTSDGDVLQALAKRVTPGKRRVLEPITLSNDLLPEATRYRRRRTSSADIVTRRKFLGRDDASIEVMTPSHTRRRSKPHLTVPIPALPVWRFPIPSPPVTSLSPDIPLSAFSPIDNPASNPSSTESSPSKPLTPSCLSREHIDDDYPDEGLSPTASYYGSFSSGASRPTTPDDQEGKHDRWHLRSSPDSIRTIDDETKLYPPLERSTSSMSSDSKETIRPSKEQEAGLAVDGETTPRAAKSWVTN